MIYKGMEEAMQGMIAMRAMQDVIANNLANANTPGYQQDTLMVSDFGSLYEAMANGQGMPVGYAPAGGGLTGDVHFLMKNVTQFHQGQLKQTEQPFDLAIYGKGFFTLLTREGIHYTRNGQFHLDGEGYLVSAEGGKVLGEKGPIQIKGSRFEVKPDGTVWVDSKKVDRLKITWVDEKQLTKVGSTDFTTTNPMAWPEVDRPKIMQGYLEMSNVNAVKEMVNLLTVMRAFEASQKMLQTEDQMARQANQIGQVR
jgi:flagellar basal-body rod protein FlgF